MKRYTIAASAAAVAASAASVEITMNHDIQGVLAPKFDTVMGASKFSTVSVVWYYKGSNSEDAAFLNTYNELATSHKKMVKFLAMDCENGVNAKHCERTGVTSTPHIRFYPAMPQPSFEYTGTKTVEKISKKVAKLMGSKVSKFEKVEDFSSWKSKNPTKTKVVLFSPKAGPFQKFKGLSTDSVFERTTEFGFVGEVGTGGVGDAIADAAGKNAKKAPVIMMISKGKTTWYGTKKTQKLDDFLAMHDWINMNSESGMGDSVKDATGQEAPEVEVEVERVRELHQKSANDLCFKQKNICAVYLQNSPDLSEETAGKIENLEKAFETSNDRGLKISWMWANSELQKELMQVMEAQEAKLAEREGREVEKFDLPTLVMVKPPRKKREEKFLSYVRMAEGKEVNKENVKLLVEKVAGGATYARADVPKWAPKPAAPKKTKTEL